LAGYSFGIIPSRLKNDLNTYKKLVFPTQQFLLTQKNKGKSVITNSLVLLTIDNKIKLAEKNLASSPNLSEILLKTISELVKEVRKI